MPNKWIPLLRPEDVAALQVDMLARGYNVISRSMTLSCIPHGVYGRAKRQGPAIVIEEMIDELECLRTVYDVTIEKE